MIHYEAPENVKYHGGYDPSDPPQFDNEDLGYPEDWPTCPSCGNPAMDGHITCGNAACDEGAYR